MDDWLIVICLVYGFTYVQSFRALMADHDNNPILAGLLAIGFTMLTPLTTIGFVLELFAEDESPK